MIIFSYTFAVNEKAIVEHFNGKPLTSHSFIDTGRQTEQKITSLPPEVEDAKESLLHSEEGGFHNDSKCHRKLPADAH
jgi:hypothetical protein